jgi:hypothetical protein
MGAIPIVKRSPIDHLYRDLPVAILDDWREISASRLQNWRDELTPRFAGKRLAEVLSMSYWRGQLRQAADAIRR